VRGKPSMEEWEQTLSADLPHHLIQPGRGIMPRGWDSRNSARIAGHDASGRGRYGVVDHAMRLA
jgi:hypothetical protein